MNPWPEIGAHVRRKPLGRWCRVVQIDTVRRRIKIYDPFWTGWVSEETFSKKWETR